MFFVLYVTGSIFASVRALATGVDFGLPLRLLVGYGVVNTALLALAWLSPLGITLNFGVVLVLATVSLLGVVASVVAVPPHEPASAAV
jgi:hypothetical protein